MDSARPLGKTDDMGRGKRAGALLVLALALAAQTSSAKLPHENHQKAVPATPAKDPAADAATQRGCPGSRFPLVSCEAITAEAAVRQADLVSQQTRIAIWDIVLGLFTVLVAGAAAFFAARAAKAARDTVNAFIEVERAKIAITLEGFREDIATKYDPRTADVKPTGEAWLKFDAVANNIGRSTALITRVAHGWQKSADLEDELPLVGPPKTYIVKAAESAVVSLGSLKEMKSLERERFLWLDVNYRSPLLKNERVLRVCFEVFGPRSNVPYRERYNEEWDREALRASAPQEPTA